MQAITMKVALAFLLTQYVLCEEINLRIVGGIRGTTKDFPFVVSFQRVSQRYHFCTGSIISKLWILTAGHCVDDEFASNLFALLGEENSKANGTEVAIQELHLHPNFNYTKKIIMNDIALVRVKGEIVFSNKIQPITLGRFANEEKNDITAIGYGYTGTTTEDTLNKHLHYIHLKTMKMEECQRIQSQMDELVDSQTTICGFGGVNKTLCFGDSGGPLIFNRKQIGVFSSLEDCTGMYPVQFTRVEYFFPWIKEITGLNYQ